MTKKVESFDHLTADEATALLDQFYAQQLDILTDRNKGPLRTTLSIIANAYFGGRQLPALQDAVLAKNGIEKIQSDGPVCYNYLPEIVAKTEARGSNVAANIKKYDQLTKTCTEHASQVAGYDGMSRFQKAKLKLEISKKIGFAYKPS